LKTATRVDLIGPKAVETLVGLQVDCESLASVLWHLVRGQAEDRATSQEQFFDALDGDSLAAGWDALREAYLSFVQPHRRTTVEAAIAEGQSFLIRTAEKLTAKITDPKIAETMDAEIDRILSEIDSRLAPGKTG
jgi:hypothetical protein